MYCLQTNQQTLPVHKMKKQIKEGDFVTYRNELGDKLKGKVVLIFTSLQGNRCVHIDNFYLTKLLTDVELCQ